MNFISSVWFDRVIQLMKLYVLPNESKPRNLFSIAKSIFVANCRNVGYVKVVAT